MQVRVLPGCLVIGLVSCIGTDKADNQDIEESSITWTDADASFCQQVATAKELGRIEKLRSGK